MKRWAKRMEVSLEIHLSVGHWLNMYNTLCSYPASPPKQPNKKEGVLLYNKVKWQRRQENSIRIESILRIAGGYGYSTFNSPSISELCISNGQNDNWGGWRKGLVVKRTNCSCRGPGSVPSTSNYAPCCQGRELFKNYTKLQSQRKHLACGHGNTTGPEPS